MSSLLAKFKALEAVGPPKKVITLNAPNGEPIKVEVRAMTGEVKKAYRQKVREKKDDNDHHEAMLVVSSLFDPDTGEQLFTAENVATVQAMPWLFDRVLMVANELNGWVVDEGKAG